MVEVVLDKIALVISVISLLIVAYGALLSVIMFLGNELKRLTGGYSSNNLQKSRSILGVYLLLGLEFLIASDILKTVLEPTYQELGILGGIVVLRTVLSYFLNRELKELKEEDEEQRDEEKEDGKLEHKKFEIVEEK